MRFKREFWSILILGLTVLALILMSMGRLVPLIQSPPGSSLVTSEENNVQKPPLKKL